MPSFPLTRTARSAGDHDAAPAASVRPVDPSDRLGGGRPREVVAVVLLATVALTVIGALGSWSPASAASHRITLPIDRAHLDQVHWTDTYGAPRSGGRTHIGVDILGPKMIPLVAANDAEVTWGRFDNGRGSIVRLRDEAGWEYQYIHINNDTPGTDNGRATCLQAFAAKLCNTMDGDGGLRRGVSFQAGELVGYLGDSGNAESTAPHLHFEIYRPNGDGSVSPVNPTPFVDAAVEGGSVDTGPVGPFASSEAAANQIMQRLEGRSATWTERLIVADAIERGGLPQALSDIVEGNPSAAMIDRLYLAFFQRDPDDDGFEHWIDARGDGHRLEDIAEWFAQSQEFETRYGGTDFGEFLDRLYIDVLGRPADADGKAYWLGQLSGGEVNRGTIVVYFTESAELRRLAQAGNELMVINRALGRPRPSGAEIEAWAALRTSTSLVDAIRPLVDA